MIRLIRPVETLAGTDEIPARLEAWKECEEREESLTATVAGRQKKDRRKMTQFLTLSGSNELTCPTTGCQWIAGRLGLSAKDAGDCREHPSRHVSAKGATGNVQYLCPHAGACA